MGETMSLEKVIEIGIQVGVKAALERGMREKEERQKDRDDRRMCNTALLLENYWSFQAHCKNAVYTKKKLKTQNAVP